MKRAIAVLCSVVLMIGAMPQPARAVGTSAAAAVLMDGETGRVLYRQNAEEPRPIASITKLMTALVAVETHPDLQEVVTILPEYTRAEGSSIYLRPEETVTLETLLYGLLLESGNDAALAVAGYCAGDVDTFVDWMNERADSIGMENTQFRNPNGLHDEEHYSSARDMALLAQACLRSEALRTIMATKSITRGERTFTNHNKLLWRYEGCVGMKTGFTEAAGRTLVSAAELDGMQLICVTLNDGNDWADHTALFDYGFENWQREKLAVKTDVYARVPVTGSLTRFVGVEFAADLVSVRKPEEEITSQVNLLPTVDAPVAAGTIAGSVTFFRDGFPIGSVYLLYSADVPSVLWSESGFLKRARSFLQHDAGVRAFVPRRF